MRVTRHPYEVAGWGVGELWVGDGEVGLLAVVDDDDPIRTMLAKVVERQNLRVDTARDGVEAIERIDEDGYLYFIDRIKDNPGAFFQLRENGKLEALD